MPTSIEAQGVTVEEAIQVALNQLGVTRDRVEIEIIHHPRSGFLGIGARRAKVRATVREAFLADGEEYDMSSGEKIGRGRRSRRSRRRRGGRGEKREEVEPTPSGRTEQREPAKERDQRTASDGDRERRRRGRGRGEDREPRQQRGEPRRQEPRQRAQEREKQERPAAPSGPAPSPVTSKPRASVDSPAAVEPPAARPMPPSVRSTEERPSGDEANIAIPAAELDVPTRDELCKRAEAALGEVLRRMGFQARVTSFYDEQESEIVIAVESDAEGLLIGRRGQTLDALEHVINRIVLSGEASGEGRLAIDVGGYRQRRRETLLELADRLKVRALTQGRRIQVSPMSPRDRRVLQGALGHDESVRMRVLGSGFYRRVVIFPVGLDEATAPLDVEAEDVAGGEPLEAEDEQV